VLRVLGRLMSVTCIMSLDCSVQSLSQVTILTASMTRVGDCWNLRWVCPVWAPGL